MTGYGIMVFPYNVIQKCIFLVMAAILNTPLLFFSSLFQILNLQPLNTSRHTFDVTVKQENVA